MKELYVLSNKLDFTSKNLYIDWKTDSYLWMCELQKWLREVHNIHIEVYLARDIRNEYHIHIAGEDELSNNSQNLIEKYLDTNIYDSYEEALELGLKNGLKLIK